MRRIYPVTNLCRPEPGEAPAAVSGRGFGPTEVDQAKPPEVPAAGTVGTPGEADS